MEADIISEGFRLSESMHGIRYMHLTGDGHSSVYHNILTTAEMSRRWSVPTMLSSVTTLD